MAETDPSFDRWRGEISTQVRAHERRLNEHDNDVRELRMGANATTIELARLGTSVEGLRGDITRALAEQAQQRRDEFTELQNAVENNRMSAKEKLTFIAVPLTVALIGALVILFSSHTI